MLPSEGSVVPHPPNQEELIKTHNRISIDLFHPFTLTTNGLLLIPLSIL